MNQKQLLIVDGMATEAHQFLNEYPNPSFKMRMNVLIAMGSVICFGVTSVMHCRVSSLSSLIDSC